MTVLAATGDTGSTGAADAAGDVYETSPIVSWPSSDPLVTTAGGTQLSLDLAGGRTAPDQVWNDTYSAGLLAAFGAAVPTPYATGGGKSAIFARPSCQDSVASVTGRSRGVPDISMSGACSGLVDTYQSFPGQEAGWYVTCGTSEATPLFSGIVALAGQEAHHALGFINPALYELKAEHAPGLVPVLTGNNTVSFSQDGTQYTVPGYSASSGYNLAAGVGTVNTALFVPELARAANGNAASHRNNNR